MATVTIDGKEYDSEALSEEARANLQNIQFCEQKMNDLKRDLAIAQTARQTGLIVHQRQLLPARPFDFRSPGVRPIVIEIGIRFHC